VRLNEALVMLAFALGGEAGARTSRRLSLTVSGDTLLRRIRRCALPDVSTPRILGIDDWAKRKGHTYGTILVDLEKRRVTDLLADREAGSWQRGCVRIPALRSSREIAPLATLKARALARPPPNKLRIVGTC